MVNRLSASFVFALLVALATSSWAGDIAAISQDCMGCHGPEGVSQCPDMPTIAGISVGSHEDAMFAYRDSARPCETSEYRHGDMSRAATDMCQIAKALTEDEIAKVAAVFAAKPFVAMKQATDPAKAKAGQVVHDQECKRCHSDGGGNPADDAGILAGQPMGYLERTFKELRDGTREQPKKMQPKMDALSDADAEALIHFYASQQ